MVFTEKINNGYEYEVIESFGIITINSPERLVRVENNNFNAEYLDNVFMAIYNAHKDDPAMLIKQTVKDSNISYIFKKRVMWEDLEEDNQDIKHAKNN